LQRHPFVERSGAKDTAESRKQLLKKFRQETGISGWEQGKAEAETRLNVRKKDVGGWMFFENKLKSH